MKEYLVSVRMLVFSALLWSASIAHAGLTDLANVPMANTSSSVVKPNVMFILDDSGSMQWSYLDDAVFTKQYHKYIGYRNHLCNTIYYNPATTYTLPYNADGTQFPAPPFTAAYYDGYTGTSTTIDLSSKFMAWRSALSSPQTPSGFTHDCWQPSGYCSTGGSGTLPNSQEAAYYFVYKGSKVANLGDGSSNDHCKNVDYDTSASSGTKNWYKVVVSSTSGPGATDERQNFANWYSYYRTRMLTMKTAAGRAFNNIGSTYRVGLNTLNQETNYSGTEPFLLNVDDFDAAQKASWYTKLYAAPANGGTPLRAALAKAGRMYAGKISGADPVAYSCQQNFTILSTDGYWNGAAGYKEDGTTPVGNQDDSLARPMFDGTATTVVYRATITVEEPSGRNTNTKVAQITVNDVEIMTGASNQDDETRKLATNIKNKIGKNGYTATASGSVVTITAPASAGVVTGVTPVVTMAANTGNLIITPAAFTATSSTSGGASDTLADVAAYYYNTDLRSDMENNVPGAGDDTAVHQHMTTFTLGLVSGTLTHTDGYATANSGDFYDIKQGPKNWPVPVADTATALDDLWHAAVNGHGTYYNASNPDSLVSGITKSLAGVSARSGSAAAAATSNLEPVAGDNYVYIALYRTVNWDGDLQAKTIDPGTGALSDSASWEAQPLLDAMVAPASDTRTIYKFDSAVSGSKLEPFTWANLSTAEQNYFNDVCVASATNPKSLLSQCDALTSTQKTSASGENLLKFIRGNYQHEDRSDNTDKLYRAREHVLGDMINSQPVYVKQPPFSYVDTNYADYKKNTRTANADARVYVAVNDGMLHAFNGGTDAGGNVGGAEKWAYIPPMVMPNLYKLADKNYSSATVKQYYVDGSPTVGDICPRAPSDTCTKNQWKTILVGGLNAGGRGYYALDITDPDSPKALWNYTVNDDADLGYSYGNPVITKRTDGTWVAVFASGYNNVSPGDGKGHLYVLNAYTGERLEKISTTAGSTDTPSGLAKINAWIIDAKDNTARRFYGGDLLGNVWRFDIDNLVPPNTGTGKEATLIAELGNVAPAGIQPITTKPELSEIIAGGTTHAVISVGTGRYLGNSDVGDLSKQSIYTFKDNLSATGLGKVRTGGTLVQQTLTTNAAGTKRVSSTNEVDWTTKSGWYVDLDPGGTSPGERVNVDMQLQLGTLTVAGNVPEDNACNLGGYAWLYNFDFKTGQYVAGANGGVAGNRLTSNSLVAGLKTIKLTSGKTTTLVTGTDGGITSQGNPSSGQGSAPNGKRVSWRELLD